METAVQIAAKTLGLPENVLVNLLSLIETPQSAGLRDSASLYTPAATHSPASPNSTDLINSLIDEYDRRL